MEHKIIFGHVLTTLLNNIGDDLTRNIELHSSSLSHVMKYQSINSSMHACFEASILLKLQRLQYLMP